MSAANRASAPSTTRLTNVPPSSPRRSAGAPAAGC